MCTLWVTVQFSLRVFPGSPPSVFQSEKLPAEVSYISLLGVTSLFSGARSRESDGSAGSHRPPLRRRRWMEEGEGGGAGKLLEADAQ